jgi:hypothetical protein
MMSGDDFASRVDCFPSFKGVLLQFLVIYEYRDIKKIEE